MSFSIRLRGFLVLIGSGLLLTSIIAACSTDKKRIIFLGDSITEAGARRGGYIKILRTMVDRARYTLIGAGIGGNKVTDLQARIRRDVLDRKPDVVVVYIGINDVWHFYKKNADGSRRKGTEADRYETGLRDVAQQIQQQGATVVFCTPTVIGEYVDSDSEENVHLARYANIVRQVARDTNSPLCDLREAFSTYLRENNPDHAYQGILTTDGVHMNEAGNRFLAEQMISCLP